MIRAILFDFGGVLAEEGFRDGLTALATEQRLDVEEMPKAGMHAVYESGFVLGRGTASDFWKLLRQRTGLIGEDDYLTNRILDGFIIRPWMIEQVRHLHSQGYITGILSDQTHWLDFFTDKYHLREVFDRIYNSYYLGKGKRDTTLFSDVAEDLNLSPTQIVFIDDDVSNVLRARQAGMYAFQYIGRDSFITELQRVLYKVI